MSSSVDTLLEILGYSISREDATRLLAGSNGDVETAVAAHFSAGGGARTSPQAAAARDTLIPMLRNILGDTPRDTQLAELLRLTNNSVQAAVEMYLDNPRAGVQQARRTEDPGAGGGGAAAAAGGSSTSGRAAARGAGRRRRSGRPATRMFLRGHDDDDGDDDEDEDGQLRDGPAEGLRPAVPGGTSSPSAGRRRSAPAAGSGAARGSGLAGGAGAAATAAPPAAAAAADAPGAGGSTSGPSAAAAPATGPSSQMPAGGLILRRGCPISVNPGGGGAAANVGAQRSAAALGAGRQQGPAAGAATGASAAGASAAGASAARASARAALAPPAAAGAGPAAAASAAAGGRAAGVGAGAGAASGSAAGPVAGASGSTAGAGGNGRVPPAPPAAPAAAAAVKLPPPAPGPAVRRAAAAGNPQSNVPAATAAPAQPQQRLQPAGPLRPRHVTPSPHLDGDMLYAVKRRQGPYPVAPLLPLGQYRRSDGSLFVDDEDQIPSRSPPPEGAGAFEWPMRLGTVTVPLVFDVPVPGVPFNPATHLAPEVQRELLRLALSWRQEGKLPADGLSWSYEEVAPVALPAEAPGGGPRYLPGGPRLALYVRTGGLICAAAEKFPDVPLLANKARHLRDTGFLTASFGIRVAATALGGPADRLARLYMQNHNCDQLNHSHQDAGRLPHWNRRSAQLPGGNGDLPVNVRVFGPGLGSSKGVALKLDVPNAPLDSSLSSDADPKSDIALGGGGGGGGPVSGRKRAWAAGASSPGAAGARKASDGKGGGKGPGLKALCGGRPKAASRALPSKGKGRAGGPDAMEVDRLGVEEDDGEEVGNGKEWAPKKKRKVANGSAAAVAAAGSAGPPGAFQGTQPGRGRGAANDASGAGPGPSAGTGPRGLGRGRGRGRGAAGEKNFFLELEFFITQPLLEAVAPPASCKDGNLHESRGASARTKADNLIAVVHTLLEYGKGLFVGPDCDGAINTGDAVAAGPRSAAAGGTGGSNGAGPAQGPRSRAGSAVPSGVDGRTASAASSAAGSGAGSDPEAGEDDDGTHGLDSLLDSIQPPRDLPEAIPPPAVQAHPKPFQLQGLEWMLRRERRGDAIGRSLLLLHPAWAQVVVGCSGLVLHLHRLPPYCASLDFFPAPVGGTCGGFLCDEMGLGKSLQTLMLIASNPPPQGWAAKPEPAVLKSSITAAPTAAASRNGGRAGVGGAAGGSTGASAGGGAAAAAAMAGPLTALLDPPDKEPVPIITTLLVTPANLQEQWVEEIQRHMQPGSLKWAIYRGYEDSKPFSSVASGTHAELLSELTADAEGAEEDTIARRRAARAARQLNNLVTAQGTTGRARLLPPAMALDATGCMVPVHACDVVLVSYEVLRHELSFNGGVQAAARLLPRLGFWRIVLDEAQLVANSNSVAAGVVCSLYRRHAWVVTGTPISSNIAEVQGLCEFLSYEPYYHGSVWRNLVQAPYTRRSPVGVATFRALLRGVMLRRSKAAVEDQLALPPCRREDLVVELNGVERAYYNVIKARYMTALEAVRAPGAAGGDPAGPGPSGSGSDDADAGGDGDGDGDGDGSAAGPSGANPRGNARGRGWGRGRAAGRAAADEGRRPNAAYQRANASLVELRQCCCHPHIVRREATAAGARGAAGAAADGGAAGGGRRSMRQIMAKMVSDAYSAYDQAVALLYGAKLTKAALSDYDSNEGAPIGDAAAAGPTGSRAAGGAEAATAAPSNGGAAGNGSAVMELLDVVWMVMTLVSEPDLLNQAKARSPDGAINWDAAGGTAAFGGAFGGLAGVAPLAAAQEARERKRRWQRLELEALMLHCYIQCIHAPNGTLALLAAQSKARFTAEAQSQASAKVGRAMETAEHRAATHAAAREHAERLLQEHGLDPAAVLRQADVDTDEDQGGGDGAAAAAATVAVRQPRKRRCGGGDTAKDAAAAIPEVKKALERLQAAARAASGAVDAVQAAQVAAEVADGVMVAAAMEADEALAAAAPEVAVAAARLQKQGKDINAVRARLGLEPVDLWLAETELRRSRRQQQELPAGGGAGGPGPSSFLAAAAIGAGQPAVDVQSREDRCSGGADGGHDGDDDDADFDDCVDDSDSDYSGGGGRRRRGGGGKGAKRPGKAPAGGKGKKRRSDDGEPQVNRRSAAGRLLEVGGTAYQEALFRAEPLIKTLQLLTSRRKDLGEERLLQTTRDKWHALQHLLNQQEEHGLAGDLPQPQPQPRPQPQQPSAGGVGAAEAPVDTSPAGPAETAAAAAADAGPSGSNPNPPAGAAAAAANEAANGTSGRGASAAAGAGPGGAVGGGGAEAGGDGAKEEFTCPICLDACHRWTITMCGHTYCTDCIHDIVEGKGSAPCPICRRQLTRADLFDSVPDEEAVDVDVDALTAAAAAATAAGEGGNAEYGAKVSALLNELARMAEEEPGCKALVFSSWGRMLRLVQEALVANGIRCALVCGDTTSRQRALHDFLHDPGCRVLLLLKSTSGGAAGLTLTMAHTAFMMEPAMNPGLEAQAAARICRLGQDRPTRVVRIIARDTVEERVLALQQHKQLHGETSGHTADALTGESVDGGMLLRFFDNL